MLVSVESTDKFDSSAIAFDCSDEEFRSIEASLYQVLHRTTANEPLRIVQQTRGQKGFEAWRAIVRRYVQRNTSDKNSAYALPHDRHNGRLNDVWDSETLIDGGDPALHDKSPR